MNNLSQNEIDKISKFFQKFDDEAAQILAARLDKDVYKKIEIEVKDVKLITDLREYKQNNFLYYVDFVKEDMQSSLALLTPEEMIADITDVMMGGNGENAYNGNLSELQINSTNDIMKKILKKAENVFQTLFDKTLAFSLETRPLRKEEEEYDAEFEKSIFNLAITEQIKFNDTKTYDFCLLLNTKDLKEILSTLSAMFGKQDPNKILANEGIGISHLNDVKIKITAELGHREVPIKYALELVRGSIVELDTITNQDIKVYANGVEVALAQVVAVEENFGLRITKILSPEERIRSL